MRVNLYRVNLTFKVIFKIYTIKALKVRRCRIIPIKEVYEEMHHVSSSKIFKTFSKAFNNYINIK